jgi:siroheme synthase
MRVLRAPLADIAAVSAAAGVEPPAVTVIGEVAALSLL